MGGGGGPAKKVWMVVFGDTQKKNGTLKEDLCCVFMDPRKLDPQQRRGVVDPKSRTLSKDVCFF